MLKFILKSLSTIIFTALLLQQSANAKSGRHASTSEVIKEIEKTLLFDKESRKKINVYKTDKTVKKSDYVIKSGGIQDESFADEERSIEIIVVDPKSSSFSLRKKERIAHYRELKNT